MQTLNSFVQAHLSQHFCEADGPLGRKTLRPVLASVVLNFFPLPPQATCALSQSESGLIISSLSQPIRGWGLPTKIRMHRRDAALTALPPRGSVARPPGP